MATLDGFGRRIDYLRLSVTDRCNLRCVYCMAEGGVEWKEHAQILTFDELRRVVAIMATLGVTRVKLTGGEPLARRGFLRLAQMICATDGLESVTLTTNGTMLADMAVPLSQAGISAVNISLDSLDSEVYSRVTRGGSLDDALAGLETALAVFDRVKLNCVPLMGINDRELEAIAGLAADRPLDVRFIELMPLGYAVGSQPLSPEAVLARLTAAFGQPDTVTERLGNGPAQYYHFSGFTGHIGLIGALSRCFCADCNRVRLTSDGFLRLCLYHEDGVDLRRLLRSGATDREIAAAITEAVSRKPERHRFLTGSAAAAMNTIGG